VPRRDKSDVSFAGLSLSRARIMGIINTTPDSFSDGGEAYDPADAIARGRLMLADGADIIDVGGESTRPGSAPISRDEELARVLPIIETLAGDGARVSIDTRHATVMAAAVEAGARIINDVTALTGDPDSLAVAAECGAHVVLMHMLGEPGTMQDDPRYEDAATEVRDYLAGRIKACEEAGMERGRIAVDPGIGFGKTLAHNLDILSRLELYDELRCPVMLGVSRKSFIAKIIGEEDPKRRIAGSLASALAGVAQGVRLLRVHDVAETRQALDVWEAIAESG
jgi:dihydropteroate synthase